MTSEIPKIIHQIWWGIDGPLPDYFRAFGDTWKKRHPDWQYVYWDKTRCFNLINDFYSQYLDTFEKFQYDIQRIDAIRYLILEKTGGLYVDFDTECLKPHDALFAGQTCCFSMEPEKHCIHFNRPNLFNNALMACIPGHPFMYEIIKTVFRYTPKTEIFQPGGERNDEILSTTGPFIITDVYEKYREKEQVFLIPAQYVSPLDMSEIALIRRGYESAVFDEKIKNAYSVHYFWGNWWWF